MVIKLETWKNGKVYTIDRDKKGHFIKGSKRQVINVVSKTKIEGKAFTGYGLRKSEAIKMFRTSKAINGVPIHWEYHSFLIQAFSLSKHKLDNIQDKLKFKLLELTNKWLGYDYNAVADWNCFNYYIATEQPKEIPIDNIRMDIWHFMVEKEGSLRHEETGSINSL